jgi:hypothetical protein
VTRIEPVPWYHFFRGVMDGRYNVRWRGRLLVPEGGRVVRFRSRGTLQISIDGKPAETSAELTAGEHEIDAALAQVEGPIFFEVRWQGAGDRLEPVPRAAFLPPRE